MDFLSDEDSALPEATHRHIVVLLVDDTCGVRQAIERVLSEYFCVISVDSGSRAIEIASVRDQQIDVLLTDVRMPGMNGAQLGERMRVLRPEVERVYMSGDCGGVSLEPQATLLQKPLDFPRLITLLNARVAAMSSCES